MSIIFYYYIFYADIITAFIDTLNIDKPKQTL
jgi:hypothetical protein